MSSSAKNSRIGVPLSPKEKRQHDSEQHAQRRAERKQDDERASKYGLTKRKVRAPDGSVKNVWTAPNTFDSMRLEDHQADALTKFTNAFSLAESVGLKAAGLEPGVDGGSADFHARHLKRNEAQRHIDQVRAFFGERQWSIFMAFFHGMTSRRAHELKGPEHRTVTEAARSLLDDLSQFYTGKRRVDPLWNASRVYLEEVKEKLATMNQWERKAVETSMTSSGMSAQEAKRRSKLPAEYAR
jgi:hypothetical protein